VKLVELTIFLLVALLVVSIIFTPIFPENDQISDFDADGIENENDYCPDTLYKHTVNDSGCSWGQSDIDGDGFNNSIDFCPDSSQNNCSPTGWFSSTRLSMDGICNVIDFQNNSFTVNCYYQGSDSSENYTHIISELTPSTKWSMAVGSTRYALESEENPEILDYSPDNSSHIEKRHINCGGYSRDTISIENTSLIGCQRNKINSAVFAPNGRSIVVTYAADPGAQGGFGYGVLIGDFDYDGVPFFEDTCLHTERYSEVNQIGCSRDQIDSDGDGYLDALDYDVENANWQTEEQYHEYIQGIGIKLGLVSVALGLLLVYPTTNQRITRNVAAHISEGLADELEKLQYTRDDLPSFLSNAAWGIGMIISIPFIVAFFVAAIFLKLAIAAVILYLTVSGIILIFMGSLVGIVCLLPVIILGMLFG
jgi:hypothetical protein